MQRLARIPTTLLTLVTLAGCTLGDKQIGDPQDSLGDATSAPDSGDGDGDTNSTETETDTDTDTGDEGPFDSCEGPFASPNEDQDCDGLGVSCDNANDQHNPDQLDQDFDDYGDVIDLCPLLASNSNAADSDKDGIGNDCDRCRQTVESYYVEGATNDPRMLVRNIPSNLDFDQDGIGDACDNCVTIANCGVYDADTPAPHGAPVPFDDASVCQTDLDMDGIGDACIDPNTNLPVVDLDNAAGPVGFGPGDDFDQDGIRNLEDWCPRQPLEQDLTQRIACTSDPDCPLTSLCADTPALNGVRYCNHPDADSDQVGDVCDTCTYKPNALQIAEGGMQVDDEDGDFVGSVCEPSLDCSLHKSTRPIRFYDVAFEGSCCVTTYPGDGQVHDPLGLPVSSDCSPDDEQGGICRQLPLAVLATPGTGELVPGCVQALADAGKVEASALTLADVGGDPLELWAHACHLPPLDQDFDGIGDACDLCPFAFDPSNEPYTDGEGMLWPNTGAACNGLYAELPGAMCSG